MPVDLPKANQTWPLFRVLTRARWDGKETSAAGWIARPMQRRGRKKHGFRLIDFERAALPMIGRARFAFDFGVFDDGLIGAATTNGTWSATTNRLDLPDLAGHEVRIQAAPKPEDDGASPAWRTVWVGYVDCVEDQGWPGASIPSGTRTYHCVDSLARTTRWRLDRCGIIVPNFAWTDVQNQHPGYNVATMRDGRLAANRSQTGYTKNDVTVNYHTAPGAGDSAWTDAQAVNHALAACRPPGEPLFTLSGTTELLSGANPWPVKEGTTVLDFLTNVLRRERGRGLAFLDWTDDVSAPEGPLTVTLAIRPQTYSDVEYTNPTTQASVTIPGAETTGTYADVDLIGDHRVIASSFLLSSPEQWRYDRLETVGERIEVLATLAFRDGFDSANGRSVSLERRWTSGEQSTFHSATTVRRTAARFRPVYALYGLPRAWAGKAGDGNNGNSSNVDYRTDDAGNIVVRASSDPADTNPLAVEVLSDTPLMEGYTYVASVPARHDGTTETGDPQRRPIMLMARVAADRFIHVEEDSRLSVTMRIDHDGIWIYDTNDQGQGIRRFSATSPANLGALYTYDQLALTVGLRLPHRVRMASYAEDKDASNARRTVTVEQPGAHLWLASPGAIWDLNTSAGTATTGHAPLRMAAAGTPGILRDDRPGLAQLHALASVWYLEPRRTASWTLRDCGSLVSFAQANGSTVDYPVLGQVVRRLDANGERHTVNTPLVRVLYDNESGTTLFETGWSSLDYE